MAYAVFSFVGRVNAEPCLARLALGYCDVIAELKNETSIAEGSIDLINRQFVRFLIRFFPLRKFSPFIMMLIFNHLINSVPFASQTPKMTEEILPKRWRSGLTRFSYPP
jgi:hypothetical protein